jgi:hypothetical protein
VDAIAKAHDATLTVSPGVEGGLDIEVSFPAPDHTRVSRFDPAAVTSG